MKCKIEANNQVCLALIAGVGNSILKQMIKEPRRGLIYAEMINDKESFIYVTR